MKFLPLLLGNLRRRRLRTALTLCSFVVALFLFGLLYTIRGAFNMGIEVAGADRVVVTNKVSLIQPLPQAYRDKMLAVPGVKQVTWANWFGGGYQDNDAPFAQFAVDHETWREMYTEFKVEDGEWATFKATRTACFVGAKLAKKYGWKIGDRIPIRGIIFPGTWEFDLAGIYHGTRPQDDETQFWFRWDYLQEKSPAWSKGNVGWYVARIQPGADAAAVSKGVDEQFANSPFETRSQSEQLFMAGFVKQMGNIELLMTTIGSVVFFTLLLVTGNAMAMAVRERTRDFAVLKALGYTDAFVLGLVLVESLLIAFTGGLIGLGFAKLFTLGGGPAPTVLPIFYFSPTGMALGVLASLLVGLAAGLLPALSAMKLQVVEALRRI